MARFALFAYAVALAAHASSTRGGTGRKQR
jgi:hypothetical protein